MHYLALVCLTKSEEAARYNIDFSEFLKCFKSSCIQVMLYSSVFLHCQQFVTIYYVLWLD